MISKISLNKSDFTLTATKMHKAKKNKKKKQNPKHVWREEIRGKKQKVKNPTTTTSYCY